MHFSIPDTEECKDDRGSIYTSYNLHVNGVFHCSVRYSQLHDFQEQLKREFGTTFYGADRFPPKRFLSLSDVQKLERRDKLEKYIQSVSQDPRIANSDIFKGFLLGAQKDTRRENPEDVTIVIYLMNGHKISVKIKSTDQTDDVLEAAATEIELPDDLVHYFALFLIKEGEDKHGSIVRRLQEFESPYISLNAAPGKNKIVLRKDFWDSTFEEDCISDSVALQLLYVQAISDIQRGWIEGSKDQMRRLEELKSKNSKKEYMQYVKTLKYYGYIQFDQCMVDYPDPDVRATVMAGNKELIFRILENDGEEREGTFKITRMRCWKITVSNQKDKVSENHLDLSFEYLLSKNQLQWISINTRQAILMSLVLQSMVEELLLTKRGGKIRKPSDRIKGPTRQFKGRDGGVITMTSSTTPSATTDSPANAPGSPSHAENGGKSFNAVESVKKFTDKFTSVPVSAAAAGQVPSSLMENDIFDGGIGEEDL